MKIKSDFITNSSSSNFLFGFNGETLEDLFDCMRYYKQKFIIQTTEWDEVQEGYFPGTVIGVENIITEIKNVAEKENLFVDISEELERVIEYIKNINNQKNDLVDKSFAADIINLKKEKQFFETAQKKGFKILQIEFGDNHGHVCGGVVGRGMDYEKDQLHIDEENLILFSINNH